MKKLKVFSPIEYIDVYSMKAIGKLRKFFISHWKGENEAIQNILTFLFLLFLFFVLKFYFDINVLGFEETMKDTFSLIIIATPAIFILFILTQTLLTAAKINNYFLIHKNRIEEIKMLVSEIQAFQNDYLCLGYDSENSIV